LGSDDLTAVIRQRFHKKGSGPDHRSIAGFAVVPVTPSINRGARPSARTWKIPAVFSSAERKESKL